MIKEIKQRIEQIKNGEVPYGYKKTKIGIVPNGWGENLIEDYLKRVSRPVAKPTEKYWRLGLRSHAKGTFHELVESPEKITMDELYVVRENDFLLNITFAWEHAVAVANKQDDCKLVSHRFPTYIATNKCDINYWKYYSSCRNFKLQLEVISPGGAGRNRVMNQSLFLKLPARLPPLNEQQKIANILSIQDKVIELKEKLLKEKEKQKKYLMQVLLTRRKRLKGFNGKWKKVKLGEILKSGNKIPVKDTSMYIKITVKLNFKGLDFANINRNMADSRPFYIRNKGEIIIGKQNYFNGSVAIVDSKYDGCICSNAIMSFSVKNSNLYFIYSYITQPDFLKKYKHLANGTGQKELSEKEFLNFEIIIPPIEEQNAIAEILTMADKELKLLQQELEEEKQKKKALMQLLLTGIVRVNS